MGLAVKLPCAFTLCRWFPFTLREPLGASVTFWEATAPVKLPAWHCPYSWLRDGLGSKLNQSGISPLAPPNLSAQLPSLPPILHKPNPNAMPSCSKAPRGLFVQSWVTRIFTGTSISPGPPSRQRPDRYTIRAGRNFTYSPVSRSVDYSLISSLAYRRAPDGFIAKARSTIWLNPSLVRCRPSHINRQIVANFLKSCFLSDRSGYSSK